MRKFIFIIIGLIIITGAIWFWFVSQNNGVFTVLAKDGVVLEVVRGQAQVTWGGAPKTLSAPASQEIDLGAKIAVLTDGQANIIFSSGTIARLAGNTEVDLSDYMSADGKISIKLNLINGTIWSRVQRLLDMDSEYEIKTVNTVAVVRGTAFNISFAAGQTDLRVLANEVAVAAIDQKTGAVLAGGEVLVGAGNEVLIDEAKLPGIATPLMVKPIPAEVLRADWFQENLSKDKKIDEAIKKNAGDGGVNSAQAVKIILPSVVSLNLKPAAKEKLRQIVNQPVKAPETTSATGQTLTPTPSASPSAIKPSPVPAKTNILPKKNSPIISVKPVTAKLSVISVAPASAPGNNYQYTKLTIKGTLFGGDAKVFLGNHALTNLKIIDSTTLEGTLGSDIAPGRYDILVVLGGQQAVLSSAFNVFQPKQ